MTKKLPLIFLLFIAKYSIAQIGFEENFISDVSLHQIQSTFVADLDGDGDMDIISNNRNEIGWHENLGNVDSFSSLRIITTEITNLNEGTYHSSTIFATDIDGDGDIDVISASSGDDKIAWYENIDGQGNFGAQQIISTNVYGASAVFSADIDNDGDMDVLSASWFDDKIAWYENIDGQGLFGVQQIISTNADYANSVYAADVDGDGFIDVLSASPNDDKIAWYKNMDGQGSFGPEQVIDTLSFAYAVVSGDIDGDGDNDMIAASRYNDIVWYENLDGNGNFGSAQVIASSNFAYSVAVKDIDSDGDLDVTWTNQTFTNNVGWAKNTDGQGSFSSAISISNIQGFRSVVAEDIDNDGNIDIVAANINRDEVIFYRNIDGQGSFASGIVMPLDVDEPRSIFSADLDGDGDMDVISASSADGKIAWFENENGSFNLQRALTMSAPGAYSVFADDLDGDGDMDILSASVTDGVTRWFENIDGLGTFGAPQTIGIGANTFTVYADDIDNDGDKDVFVGRYNRLVWYENVDGLGNFGTSQVISTTINYVLSIHSGDIDNDGDKDIISISRFNNMVAWFENIDGQGTFGPRQIITTQATIATAARAADFDNDGDLDVVSSSSNDDKIAWYENTDGQGAFGPQQIISTTASEATNVYTADVDSDGDIDVLSACFGSNQIVLYENLNGLGSFSSGQIISSTANSVSSVICADIDNDNDLDVLGALTGSKKLVWFNNLGELGNEINGTVILDENADGCDTNDIFVSNVLVGSTNGINEFSTFTTNGSFQIPVNDGAFTTTIMSLPSYYTSTPVTHTTSFTGQGNTDTVDFCLTTSTSVNDLVITVYPSIEDPRPGFDTTYQIVYRNIGTTQLSGDVTFQFDNSKIQFLNASQTVAAQTANTLTFNYSNLNPFEIRTIDLNFNVFTPPVTNIDDTLTTTVTINPTTADATPEDNIFTLNQTVIGSYDPNDIAVLEGDRILIDDIDKYLHYIIRFQNTGTASATNVRVDHVLDNKLDWTTIQLESLSHQGRVEIIDGNNVSFIFKNINLPDSTNDEPNSHGYITFKIKPKNTVAIGDIVDAVAEIYFDFNPAIITNTASTEIVETLSVTEFDKNAISMYPNPAKEKVIIKSKFSIQNIMIVDMNGRELKTQLLSSSSTEYQLDINNLSTGMYFVKIETSSGTLTQKLIKH
ncbi:T9SS type A sorting domain-containing protein [Kordia zhangzhouensis]|uniref:T9SS type A sorting domain-containing protein n=1 Tax=Kordia zhangzhouensis TaxID=1620405 RepID=UPI00069C9324|nr:T9SS type A sorting domain-containing protein [Kordia zhangzhouensis]